MFSEFRSTENMIPTSSSVPDDDFVFQFFLVYREAFRLPKRDSAMAMGGFAY
jgi:hypothetical protein